jgi:hypothetical protein
VLLVELGGLALACGIVSAAVYAVLQSVLAPQYPGLTGYLRSFVPLGADALGGSCLAWALMRKSVSAWLRAPVGLAALCFVAYTVNVELVAASAAPGAAMRSRVEAAIGAPLRACPLDLSPAPADEGRQAKLQREQNEAQARAGQLECQRRAQADHDAAVENAKGQAPGEDSVPRMLAWIAAPCASAFLPLLVAFVRVARRHSRAGGAA